ncbi:GNAT family N-acetyltransferase [uncultured Exiguobacterium sp.]|uniref:GNAT family N-acetyltransferase n=1 Tax=uncultured Exiguobacterium sp. TaxID=202669 RepID=UPI0025F7BCE0|nr:GNAT family N-acetyltransferase [uncultured Exiguobacterium sp.]
MIRRLRSTDHAALLELQRLAYRVEARLLGTVHFPPLSETIDDIKAEQPNGFVYLLHNNVVGAITYADRTITRLVVDPVHFRQGIAQSLLQHLLEHEHVKYVMTGARNHPALALYTRFDFIEVRREWHQEIELVFLNRV